MEMGMGTQFTGTGWGWGYSHGDGVGTGTISSPCRFLVGKIIRSVVAIRLSVSSLAFEPLIDLLHWFCMCIGRDNSSPRIETPKSLSRSRARISKDGKVVGLTSILACLLSVTGARSSSGGVAICYALPVLWMQSCFQMAIKWRREKRVYLKCIARGQHRSGGGAWYLQLPRCYWSKHRHSEHIGFYFLDFLFSTF